MRRCFLADGLVLFVGGEKGFRSPSTRRIRSLHFPVAFVAALRLSDEILRPSCSGSRTVCTRRFLERTYLPTWLGANRIVGTLPCSYRGWYANSCAGPGVVGLDSRIIAFPSFVSGYHVVYGSLSRIYFRIAYVEAMCAYPPLGQDGDRLPVTINDYY